METSRTLRASDGAAIGYRLWRPGAPRRTVVLIHGLASNLTRWSEFVEATRLKDSWDIVRLDLRGHGGSVQRGRIGMAQWCADIAEILRAEAVPQAVLVGHCLGANIALWCAAHARAPISSLVLIEPMFRQALKGALARAATLRPLLAPIALLCRGIAALGLHRRRLAPLDLQALDLEARAAMAGAGRAFPEERYASPWQDLRSLPVSVYLQDLLAVTAPAPALSGIRCPALAILSSGTGFSDPAKTEEVLRALARCEIVRVRAHHWIPTEQPDALRGLIERWCDAAGQAPPGAQAEAAEGTG